MCLSVCIRGYICLSVYTWVCLKASVSVCVHGMCVCQSAYMYTWVCVKTSVSLCLHGMCVSLCIHGYVSLNLLACVCMVVYVYIS